MIYTVTTNPNIDYYMDLRAPLRVGGINRSGRELLAPGGKGINVSLMLQTLGKPSCVLGYLAGPTGRLLEALMKDTGCDCHWFWLLICSAISMPLALQVLALPLLQMMACALPSARCCFVTTSGAPLTRLVV